MTELTDDTEVKRIPYDGVFKNFLKEPRLLKEFLEFIDRCDIIDEIDFDRVITPLDTDMNNIYVITESRNKRFADVVLQVYRKGQDEQFILHFEPQSFRDKTFPYRMYTYHRRIEVTYDKEAVSFAICFKDYPTTAPNEYRRNTFSEQLEVFIFNQIHLKDGNYAAINSLKTNNLAEIALCGLMDKEGITNLDLYLKCLENLSKIDITDNKDSIYKIVLSCMYYFIKLDTKQDRECVINRIKEIIEGEEDLMVMMNLVAEDKAIETKKESIVKFSNAFLRNIENDDKDRYLTHLNNFLDSIYELDKVEELEDQILQNPTPEGLIQILESLRVPAEAF